VYKKFSEAISETISEGWKPDTSVGLCPLWEAGIVASLPELQSLYIYKPCSVLAKQYFMPFRGSP